MAENSHKKEITTVYVYLMENAAKLSQALITAHVEHLKHLDDAGKLMLCGPFSDYPGGMVVFTANDREEAQRIAESDPFISSGAKTYELRCLELADKSNHYLL